MKNTFFQFRQFKIEQQKSSMKVCTDSCLFGAWVAEKIVTDNFHPKNILDIGSGTGLLSLMLAQKISANIDAIEIDQNSSEQTSENFLNSPWNQRLRSFHHDIKEMDFDKKYDFIISNPPFFESDLQSEFKGINLARHKEGLTLSELMQQIHDRLESNGRFAVLLPYHRISHFKNLAKEYKMYPLEELWVRQTPMHSFFRGLLLFGETVSANPAAALSIKDDENHYTIPFSKLLKDYYLEK